MKANVKKIRKFRRFSLEFKQKLVEDFESGKYSTKELSHFHSVSQQSIYRWIYQFSKTNKEGYRVVEHVDSSDKKLKDMQKDHKELLAMLAKKQIQIEYLEKMIELANEEFNTDIKKNFTTQLSNILKTIEEK